MSEETSAEKDHVYSELEDFILKNDHPCLMAQSVFREKNVVIRSYGRLGSSENTPALMHDLHGYISNYDFDAPDMYTFIAVFSDEDVLTEEDFESRLWQQLQYLHHTDDIPWDPDVENDPDSTNFSFSLFGKAFYVVGMHPGASRLARRSPRPAMVFNLHHQFERLRKMNAYEITRDKIRERDMQLQGSLNPMLADFGENKEARQYSGRAVDDSWKCPFHPKQK